MLRRGKIEGGTTEIVVEEEMGGIIEGVIGVLQEVVEEGMMIIGGGQEVHQGTDMMIIVEEEEEMEEVDVTVVHQGTDMMIIVVDVVVPEVRSTGTGVAVNLQGGIGGVMKIIAGVIAGTTAMWDVVVVMIETTGTIVDTSRGERIDLTQCRD